MNLKTVIFFLFISIGIFGNLNAQNEADSSFSDHVKIESNSTNTINGAFSDSTLMKIHSPKKAAILSAIIPGAGQVYNKKYWKLPLIYGAGLGMVYIFTVNYKEYNRYRDSYITRVNFEKDSTYSGPDHFPTISNSGLQSESERTQKNYELAAVGIALVYALQIVDAAVDAHLKTFDVSDDLSLSVRPTIMSNPYQMTQGVSPTLGFRLNLRFK